MLGKEGHALLPSMKIGRFITYTDNVCHIYDNLDFYAGDGSISGSKGKSMPASSLDETNLNERQAQIVALVEQKGFVTIETLAKDFDVSTQTVRREIIRLDELGFIQRFHGGAGRRGSGERLSYESKQNRDQDLKARIGRAIAKRIMPGQAIFLDVGTTAEAAARALADHGRLTVVTPSAAIARLLAGTQGIDVVITGGRVVGPDISMVGPIAQATLAQYRLDWAIVSCSAIEEDGTVLDFDADKIALKRLAMTMARRKALLADHGKFSRSALISLGGIDSFDLLVTDAAPPDSIASLLGEGRVAVADV
jgi:DeoR family glycerol-3-phosphate regulon repressor